MIRYDFRVEDFIQLLVIIFMMIDNLIIQKRAMISNICFFLTKRESNRDESLWNRFSLLSIYIDIRRI